MFYVFYSRNKDCNKISIVIVIIINVCCIYILNDLFVLNVEIKIKRIMYHRIQKTKEFFFANLIDKDL